MIKNIFSPAATLIPFAMPYTSEHKVRTRAKIVASARVLFNRFGFEQVSIDGIMQHAGLTRGGFYHHFASKDELYVEVLQQVASCRRVASPGADASPDRARTLARELVEVYLSDEILADIDRHCPLVALPSDVARAGQRPRAAYTRLVDDMVAIFRAAFEPGDDEGERKALAIVSLCVGGMLIARTSEEPRLRRELRAAARAQALALLAG